MRVFLEQNEELMAKLNDTLILLNYDMNSISKRAREVSDIFTELYCVANNFNEVFNQITKKLNIKDTYEFLSEITNSLSDSIKSQAILLDTEIREYFSYIKKEYTSFKEVKKVHYYVIGNCKVRK